MYRLTGKPLVVGLLLPEATVADEFETVFRAAGVTARAVTSVDEALRFFVAHPPVEGQCVVFIVEHAPPSLDGFAAVRLARDRFPGIRSVLLTGYDIDQCLAFALEGRLGNLIAKTRPLSAPELLYATFSLCTGDVFGLPRHLGAGATMVEEVLVDSARKPELIARLREFTHEQVGRLPAELRPGPEAERDLLEVVALVFDEMLGNAIYGAPRDAAGGKKYTKGTRVELLPEEAVTVRWGSDGRRLGFAVEDRMGTLTRHEVLEFLLRARSEAGIDELHGGGGFLVIRSFLDLFILNIRPGVRTEAIGLLDLTAPRPAAEERNKSLHVFEL